MLVELEDTISKQVIWVGNVYGTTLFGLKEGFWNSLEQLGGARRHNSCIILGDFNVTISTDERRGGSKLRDPLGSGWRIFWLFELN